MSVVSDTYGAVFAEGSVVNLARLETADGELVEPSSMASASYSILARDLCGGIGDTPIAGHLDQALVPSAVLFDTLQNGDIWDQDETGTTFVTRSMSRPIRRSLSPGRPTWFATD